MNILLSCIGRRGYIADYFRAHLEPGDRILGTSNSAWTSAFQSCDLGVVLPDIASPDYISTLLCLCQEEEIVLLLSFFDLDVDRLSHHRRDFRALGVVPILPSAEVSDICFDKYRTVSFSMEYGFDAPQTYLDLAQALQAIDEGQLAFPVVVKPRRGFASQNLFWARNGSELEVFFHYASNMLIQEAVAGQEYHLDILTDLEGQVVAVVPKRKVAMRAGETDQAQVCDTPELMDWGLRLGTALGDLGHVGPLDVDVFVDGGRIVILEMNPRFGGGYPASHLAAADFPALILNMVRGEPLGSRMGRFKPGVIMMKEYNILGGEPQELFGSVLNMRGLA